MPAGQLNIKIEQGATLRKTLTWKTGQALALVDLTGYTARMQLRASPASATVLLSLTEAPSSVGQLILGGPAGTIEIYIKHTATDTLTAGGVYDLEVVAPNTDVIRLVQGKFSLNLNVTK